MTHYTHCSPETLQVNLQNSYEINFGDLSTLAEHINLQKTCIIASRSVYSLHTDRIGSLRQHCPAMHILEVDDSEPNKTWEAAGTLLDRLLSLHLDRSSVLVAVGGGVVGDLVGFVSSVYQRGIGFVQVPTTLLAMVDSSVGGKTAVNLGRYGKNLVGTFHQPSRVLVDLDMLSTLPEAEWYNGLAEVAKYALLAADGGQFCAWLMEHSSAILAREPRPVIHSMIAQSIQHKIHIVEQDEKETTGLRMLLNLGHTFGHVIETFSEYRVSHGQAVSIGCSLAATVSLHSQLIDQHTYDHIQRLLSVLQLPTGLPAECRHVSVSQFIDAFAHDKKTTDKKTKFVLPCGAISQCIATDEVNTSILSQVLSEFLVH